MDLSRIAMERIERLSPEVKARCCKKLQDGTYSTKVMQFRVSPLTVIGVYELIDRQDLDLKDESSVIKKALEEFIKQNKK